MLIMYNIISKIIIQLAVIYNDKLNLYAFVFFISAIIPRIIPITPKPHKIVVISPPNVPKCAIKNPQYPSPLEATLLVNK